LADAGDAAREVREVIAGIGAAWQGRRYDDLARYFDDDVVIAQPGFQGRVSGRAACIASYREFMERSTIDRYAESPATVDVFGETAVATYRWEMAWTSNGVARHDAGHDVLVLHRGGSAKAPRWRVVWRTLLPDSPAR